MMTCSQGQKIQVDNRCERYPVHCRKNLQQKQGNNYWFDLGQSQEQEF